MDKKFLFLFFVFILATSISFVYAAEYHGSFDVDVGSGTIIINGSENGDYCGDGILQASKGEECDLTSFGPKTCSDYGFSSGSLSCSQDCKIISSGCSNPPAPAQGGGGGGGGGSSFSSSSSVCGNGICGFGEDSKTCPQDCGGTGNGTQTTGQNQTGQQGNVSTGQGNQTGQGNTNGQAGITGAVIGSLKKPKVFIPIIFLGLIGVLFIIFSLKKKK